MPHGPIMAVFAVCCVLLGALVPCGWGGDSEPVAVSEPWTMPVDERVALDQMIGRAIAAGLPDAQGGTLVQGVVRYLGTREDGGTQNLPRLEADGIHLRLADGRMLINLRWLVDAQDQRVDASDVVDITVPQMMEWAERHPDLRGWKPTDIEERMAWVRQHYEASQVPRIRAMLLALPLVRMAQRLDPELAVPLAMMWRLGLPQMESAVLGCAANTLKQPELLDDFRVTPSPLVLLAGDDEDRSAPHVQMKPASSPTRSIPPVVTVMRQLLIRRWLHGEAAGSAAPAALIGSRDQARRWALAMVEDTDPWAEDIRQFVPRSAERERIPATPPTTPDVAGLLAWWDGEQSWPSVAHQQRDAAEIDDLLQHPTRATPEERDELPARIAVRWLYQAPPDDLFAAIGNDAVSRWQDHGRIRTIGDNALRALGQRFGYDPRRLIDRDPSAPWTPAERADTVARLQHWWQMNRQKPWAEVSGGVVAVLPLSEIAVLLAAALPVDRDVLLSRLAGRWAAKAPEDPDPLVLAGILRQARQHAGLDAVVRTWPVTGRCEALLTAWHLAHGRSEHLDRLLQTTVRPVAETTGDAPAAKVADFSDALRIAASHPDDARLARLMAMITTPDPAVDPVRILLGVYGTSFPRDPVMREWEREDTPFRWSQEDLSRREHLHWRRSAMPLVLLALLLDDQRLAPEQLVFTYNHLGDFSHLSEAERNPPPPPLNDIRLADLIGLLSPSCINELVPDEWSEGGRLDEVSARPLLFNQPRAERDRIIAMQRKILAEVLPLALTAARLTVVVPGMPTAPPPAKDPASDF